MNRIILRPSDLSKVSSYEWTEPGCSYTLVDQFRVNHLNEIIGVNVGDQLRVCLVNWGNGTCIVESTHSDQVTLRLNDASRDLNAPLGLLLGLCRPPSMRKVIEHSTGMGVTHFFIIKCALSEKSYLNSRWLQPQKLGELLDLGMAQDYAVSRIPEVHIFENFKSFIEGSVNYLNPFESKIVLSKNANQWMTNPKGYSCFAVGPERGFTSGELKQLVELDFIETKVSESVLRVEHACFYGLSQLEYLRSYS